MILINFNPTSGAPVPDQEGEAPRVHRLWSWATTGSLFGPVSAAASSFLQPGFRIGSNVLSQFREFIQDFEQVAFVAEMTLANQTGELHPIIDHDRPRRSVLQPFGNQTTTDVARPKRFLPLLLVLPAVGAIAAHQLATFKGTVDVLKPVFNNPANQSENHLVTKREVTAPEEEEVDIISLAGRLEDLLHPQPVELLQKNVTLDNATSWLDMSPAEIYNATRKGRLQLRIRQLSDFAVVCFILALVAAVVAMCGCIAQTFKEPEVKPIPEAIRIPFYHHEEDHIYETIGQNLPRRVKEP